MVNRKGTAEKQNLTFNVSINISLMSETIWSPKSFAFAENAFSTKKRLRIQPKPLLGLYALSTWETQVLQRSTLDSGSYSISTKFCKANKKLTLPWSSLLNLLYGLIFSASTTDAYSWITFQTRYVCKTSFGVLSKILDRFDT